MTRLKRFLSAQLPDWAQPGHAIRRYTYGQPGSRHRQIVRALAVIATVLILLLIGVIALIADAPLALNDSHLRVIFAVLYFPLVMMQLFSLVLTLLIGSGAITNEQQRGTWETFKITSHGAELFIHARWGSILGQLRISLIVIIGMRLVFAALMLVDVTREHGTYLDLYRSGITPAVPLEGAVLLLAALMTATLLQYPVMLGLNAALGLLLAATIQHRTALLAVRFGALVVQIAVFVLAMFAGARVLSDGISSAPSSLSVQWASLLLMGALGDQGLRFMDLETTLRTWPDVDYAVLLGGALLLVVLIEMALIRSVLAWAARHAARPLKE